MLSIWSSTLLNISGVIERKESVTVEETSQYFFTLPVYYNHRLINTTMEIWKFQMDKIDDSTNRNLKNFFLHKEIANIDKFLSLLSFITSDETYNPEVVQIEEFVCLYDGYSTQKKNYTLKFFPLKHHLNRVSNLKDKIICAKYLIMMMNEIDHKKVNMVNYCNLVKWLSTIGVEYLSGNSFEIYPKGW
jgi:hypothetical protein